MVYYSITREGGYPTPIEKPPLSTLSYRIHNPMLLETSFPVAPIASTGRGSGRIVAADPIPTCPGGQDLPEPQPPHQPSDDESPYAIDRRDTFLGQNIHVSLKADSSFVGTIYAPQDGSVYFTSVPSAAALFSEADAIRFVIENYEARERALENHRRVMTA